MVEALRRHWPEYLMEAAGLGLFMVSAAAFGTLLEYPGSPLNRALPDPLFRRAVMGLAMGATAVAIIYSPWGKRSGAHINPAITLTFFRLGKIEGWDAFFYITAQFLGGLAGILLVALVVGGALNHFVPADDRGSACHQCQAAKPVHGSLCRTAGRYLHRGRGPALRHEHESRSQLRLGGAGGALDRPLGLLHGPTPGDVAGG
jgi:glycerol uptake facilitator-like aquaporin